MAEAVDRVRVAAESRRIELTLVAEDGLRVFGDAELLSTAVTNLVTNAVNYSGSGTRVGIGARRAGDTVEVTVTDQGQSASPRPSRSASSSASTGWTPRARGPPGGTGLGLAIVKHICDNHGGEVSVWSQEGRGSTFTMTLPAAADRPRADELRTTTGHRSETHEERALHDAHPDR